MHGPRVDDTAPEQVNDRSDSVSSPDEDAGSKSRNPLNGVAIFGGLLLIAMGLADANQLAVAGAVLFSGGLISYSVQESSR